MIHGFPGLRLVRATFVLAALICAVACGPMPPHPPMAPPPPHAMHGGDHPCMADHPGAAAEPCGHAADTPCPHHGGAPKGDGAESMPCDPAPGQPAADAKGDEPCHGESAAPCAHQAARRCDDVRWTDLSTLAASLPPSPIDVVFDIDDTVLFTSPGFQWGSQTYGADIVKAGAPVREADLPNDDARRRFREFWSKMNNELDQWSVKKWIAAELIKLHKNRGDRIHFVTKRVKTGSEKLTELIAKTFDLKGMEPVIFTDRSPKVDAFKQVHAQVSYGDSDGDIRDSLAAGARPIRVQRARNSVNDDPTHDGAFGEEVLIDSAN